MGGGDIIPENGGSGTLSITKGGRVVSSNSYIGYSPGSKCEVTVDGIGSSWTNGNSLSVGNSGAGTLSITGGAAVAARNLSITSASLVAIDVGCSSSFTVGGGIGTVSNSGTIRILAGPSTLANFAYSPISAKTWNGTGSYQAVGGTWDKTHHSFTASSVANGTASLPLSLNLGSVQRALISDNGTGGTGWAVGESFPAAGTTTNITFTAMPINDTLLGLLRSQLSPPESFLSAWTFSTTNFTVSSSNPVYLSFNVGASHPAEDLEVWHYDGASGWAKYDAFDLTYDGTFASFTATSFSGYAMVAVPESGTLSLLALGLWGLLAVARRRRRGREQ